MKGINKKACRRELEPVPAPSAGCGLFFVEPVKYVIRTTVKNIGHRRLLVLCLYTSNSSAGGKATLAYTMFQASDTFVTYDHNPLAKTRWRDSMLENLESCYYRRRLFAFYSKSDENRVIEYCRRHSKWCGSDDGYDAISHLQTDIRDEEARKRQRKRERQIHSRMKTLHALPRNLNDWIRRKAVPAYFFYDYKRGAKIVKGICSACGSEVEIPGAKHNGSGVCPCCHREFVVKSNAKRGRLIDRTTTSVIQKVSENEIVIRIMKTWSTWPKGEPQNLQTYEETRIFVKLQEDGKPVSEAYHDSCESSGITPWKAGYPPVMFLYQNNFNSETGGTLFCPNLTKELAGTPWQFCPIQLFYESISANMEVLPFLIEYLLHPKLEHLVKVGFIRLVADIVYRRGWDLNLDETQNRTHRILGVPAEDIPFLRGLDPDTTVLNTFKQYCRRNLADRQSLLLWQRKNAVNQDVLPVLDFVTPHKMMRYLDRQYSSMMQKAAEDEGNRYHDMQDVLREYRDYLEMCKKEGYDLHNSFVLFPANLQDAHDKVARRIKIKANAKKRREFKEAYQRIVSQPDFTIDGMKIVYPSSPDEIVAEGHALHHCVGSYVDRVAKHECIILFLRRCDEESKPFYTIEVRNKKITQARGMRNSDVTPEVKRFLSKWEKKVLQRIPDKAENLLTADLMENAA